MAEDLHSCVLGYEHVAQRNANIRFTKLYIKYLTASVDKKRYSNRNYALQVWNRWFIFLVS